LTPKNDPALPEGSGPAEPEGTPPPSKPRKPSTTTRFFGVADENGPPRLPRGLLVAAFSLLVVVLLVFIFRQLAVVLKPLFIAAFIAYLIMPAHQFLVRIRIPPLLSYGVLVLFLVVIAFALFRIADRSVQQIADRSDVYGEKIADLKDRIDEFLDEMQSIVEKVRGGTGSAPAAETALREDSPEETRAFIISTLTTMIGGFGSFLFTILAIVIYLLFLIAEAESFRRRVNTVFESERAEKILEVVRDINKGISEYISVKTLVSFMVALLSTIVLGVFGVDFFLLWGILTFLLNFIPYVGSAVALVLPLGLALLQFGLGWAFLAVVLLLSAVQSVIGYVVEPKLTGERLDLSPIMIMLALTFWGWLWGFVGAVLAVPLIVSVKVILDHIEATRPIAGLMSNMPAIRHDKNT
jgi:AI-2 transport protein TqsA